MTTQAPDMSSPQAGNDDSAIPEVAPTKAETVAEATIDEPQNALTNEFTEEEWKALRDFRTKLPEIWKAVYSPDEAAAEPQRFTLWGVNIDPKTPASDARASVILMKFLRARELNIENAQTMLTATLRWRKEFRVDGILQETFPEIFSGVGRIFGKDKGGRPVVYNIYGGHDTKTIFGDVKQFIRWRVQLMEKCIQFLDFETIDQTVQVHDYDGVSMLGGRDANQKAAASEATTLFQNYYPEMLHKKFFINVPTILTWMFWMFKPVISAKTYSKMNVVGTGKFAIANTLLPLIDAKELPKRYGGESETF